MNTQEELKKLYSQLEIYKRKKMLANNPHLQKKRSSKKGLGRSLMRRITEIPESVHRQCSREDKEAGEHGSNRNSICMLKKNPFDVPHTGKPAKEETLKNKVFSLKKSHSSYDHVRDQNEDSSSSTTDKMEVTSAEGSLLETLMGKKLVKKKSSENISAPSESTESVPLVCKSASAHNLTADKKPIYPRPSMLQKSLSVIASAKEKTLGLTGKTPNAEDNNKKTQSKGKEPNSENESQSKTSVNQTVESKQNLTKGRIMKQTVSSSEPTIYSDPIKGNDLYDLSEVCPWEVEDIPTPSENKVQKHVSIAPEETTTVHGGSTKAGKTQHQKHKTSDVSTVSSRNSKEIPRTTAVRADICPWEEGGENNAAQVEKSKQQTTGQFSKPPPATETSKTFRAEICPWDFEEANRTTELSQLTEVSKQKKGSTPVEGRNKNPSVPDPSKTSRSLQLQPSKSEVCPWDCDSAAVSSNLERTPSPSQGSKTKEDPTKKKVTSSTRTLEKEKPKDAGDEKGRTKAKDKSKTSEKQPQQKLAEVCPWDVNTHQELPLVEKRRSTNVGAAKVKQAEVCPWDFEDTADKKGLDKNASAVKQSSLNPKGGTTGAAKKADVCPWDFDDSAPGKKA